MAESEDDVRPIESLENPRTVEIYTIFVKDVLAKLFFEICLRCLNDFVEALLKNKSEAAEKFANLDIQ